MSCPFARQFRFRLQTAGQGFGRSGHNHTAGSEGEFVFRGVVVPGLPGSDADACIGVKFDIMSNGMSSFSKGYPRLRTDSRSVQWMVASVLGVRV